MRYRTFGGTGLRVSELCLGTVTFGEDWGYGASKEESRRIFDAYVRAGGNFIDTADSYTNGTSERFVGEFTALDRDRYVISTKYTITRRHDDPNASGNQRKNMLRAIEESLNRLRTDYVDIYWVHAWDPLTPIEEVMRSLHYLVQEGKVLYLGISNAPAWVVARANAIAEERGWTPFSGIQVQYGLIERTPERELIPMARMLGLAVTVWSPLGGGVLTGKYNRGTERVKGARLTVMPTARYYLNDYTMAIASKVAEVAREVDRSPSQVALQWLRQRGQEVIPILGNRSLQQLEENLGCLDAPLPEEQMRTLDEASAVDLGYPLEFLGRDMVRHFIFGDMVGQIDTTRRLP